LTSQGAPDASADAGPQPRVATRCLINGEASTQIVVADRGLSYGDGLFETIAVRDGRPCAWLRHLDRLALGAARLRLPLPSPNRLKDEAARLCATVERGTLKIILTRGPAGRGYRPPQSPQPTRILLLSEAASAADDAIRMPGARVRVCETRLGLNPQLAGLKHLNRLEQVLASAECSDPGVDEGLMLDADDTLVCGTMTNLFMVDEAGLHTPLLDRNGVAGTARAALLAAASEAGIAVYERRLSLDEFLRAPAALLTNALIGIWPIQRAEGRTFDPDRLPWPLLEAVQAELLQPEPHW
jgi:4-amino-4-deoxychorismate lyase